MSEILRDSSEDHRFLLVGDPKQSIYGWRGGRRVDPQSRCVISNAGAESLAKSYRSAPVLMDFVNTFSMLPKHAEAIDTDPVVCSGSILNTPWPPQADSPVVPRASERWLAAGIRITAHPEKPGLVTVAIATEATGYRQPIWPSVWWNAFWIGMKDGLMSWVLASTNAELAEVFLLCKEHGIAASMEGRSPLLDAFAFSRFWPSFGLLTIPETVSPIT